MNSLSAGARSSGFEPMRGVRTDGRRDRDLSRPRDIVSSATRPEPPSPFCSEIDMPDKRDHRYFFVHIMKTAGATVGEHIRSNFRPEEVYPSSPLESDLFRAYMNIPDLLDLPAERRAQARVVLGHFPYSVVEEMGMDFVTMTVLREPVARTISYLKHATRQHPRHRGMSLEQVYEDPFYNPAFILNHQAKIFSLGTQDKFWTYMEGIVVDEQRLEVAKANLAKVDVIGLTEHYGSFLQTMEEDFGWDIRDVEDQNVSRKEHDVSQSFVDRIVEDNRMDIEFYDYAAKLWKERAARRTVDVQGEPHAR